MFKKVINVLIITRTENEDHFKIDRLVSTWKEPGTVAEVCLLENGRVEVSFKLHQGMIKKFEKDLNLLKFVGIEAKLVN